MGDVSRLPALPDYSGSQLKIIQANNPDLEPNEFNSFIELCRATGLSPFRRQLSAIVFGKNAKDRSKRRVAFVIGIDGYRSMADRTGTYMPHEKPPEWELCEPNDLNPAGLVSCTYFVKKYAHGNWHTFQATAHWAEFAPVEQEWGADETGHRKPTGKKKLSDTWAKMPRVMLAKVAEAQALRRGWPDTLAGIYTEEEVEREKTLDLTAAEVVEQVEVEERQRRVGGANSILVDWCDGSPLTPVPPGQFADRVLEWAQAKDRTTTEIKVWEDRNKHGLNSFWALRKSEALELKKQVASRMAELTKKEVSA